jgi:uncharacterized membrane protein YdjX (TVP38/TMEM64 family)
MSVIKNTRDALINPDSQIHWVRLVVAFAGLIVLSFALAAGLNILKDQLNIDLYQYSWLAYLSVFVISLLANATIIAPVPFAIAIMATAAQYYNPVLIALAGAAGGTLGELSGYYAGRFGRKIAIPEEIISHKRITYWVEKFGFWAIAVISFQPIIPFDVGGMVAGVSKMPLHKFLPALFLGKFPKYLILVYFSMGLIDFLPSWLTRLFV